MPHDRVSSLEPTIDAVVFDMDGVLIDSEPIWQDVEIEVFGEVGVTLTRDDCRSTMGMRVDEVVQFWAERRPWRGPSNDEVMGRIMDGVVAEVRSSGRPLPGALDAVAMASDLGLQVGLASSSYDTVIEAVLDRLGIADRFSVAVSAEGERHGKPHPAVYLTTLAALGVDPRRSVAIEDSAAGVLAARSASMRCIAVPDASVAADGTFGAADVVLESLTLLRPSHLDPARRP